MVMCRGSTVDNYSRGRYYKASLVYFPSQDAICASVIPRGLNTMWPCGIKRKMEEEEETNISYVDQRQSVLNISMIKLRTPALRKTEQPLRRSVLIFNTLKTIETELKLEGVHWNLPTRPSLLPSIQPDDDVTLDPLPTLSESTAEVKSPAVDRGCPQADNSQEKHVAMDTSSASDLHTSRHMTGSIGTSTLAPSQEMPVQSSDSSPSLFSDPRSILDSFFCLQSSQQGPLPTFSSLLDLDCSSSSSVGSSVTSSIFSASSSPTSLSPSSPHLPVSSSSSSSSQPMQHSTSKLSTPPTTSTVSPALSTHSHSLPGQQHSSTVSATATEQDVLSDFDFSSLDVDIFSLFPSTFKLPPLSPEDLQDLPHPESFTQNRASSCNPKHTDLYGDDLDSIMQILVGM